MSRQGKLCNISKSVDSYSTQATPKKTEHTNEKQQQQKPTHPNHLKRDQNTQKGTAAKIDSPHNRICAKPYQAFTYTHLTNHLPTLELRPVGKGLALNCFDSSSSSLLRCGLHRSIPSHPIQLWSVPFDQPGKQAVHTKQ